MAPKASIIDGKAAAAKLRAQLKEQVEHLRQSNPDFAPGLAIVQAGDRPDSNVYIRNKMAAAREIGMHVKHIKLPRTVSQLELIEVIDDLNRDSTVDGVIVQLPLETDQPINADAVINHIAPQKDIDGLSRENAGRLARGELEGTLVPCTPRGCLYLVESTGTKVEGKHVVMIGRSKIVGMPCSELFLNHNATVTTCHAKTTKLDEICRTADIVIVAIGHARFIKGDWIKPGAIVIDCGINSGPPDANGKSPLLGDVDFATASERAAFITPVPGGVGPMTVAMLMQNTVDQATKRLHNSAAWRMGG